MGKDFTRPPEEYQKDSSKNMNEQALEEPSIWKGEQDKENPYDHPERYEWTEGTHSVLVGYLMWIFGWMGAHRFYYGRPVSGTIWFLTGGLFLIGWLIDLFLIPGMDRDADMRNVSGRYDHTVAFLLLTFLGVFGIHRFYIGKLWTGVFYLLTLGIFGLGILYDFWTMNEQVSIKNAQNLKRTKRV